jgi:hypothetical protein
MDTAVLLLIVVFASIIFGFYQLATKMNSPRPGSARRARTRPQQRPAAPVVEAIPYTRVRGPDGWSEWSRAEPIEATNVIVETNPTWGR